MSWEFTPQQIADNSSTMTEGILVKYRAPNDLAIEVDDIPAFCQDTGNSLGLSPEQKAFRGNAMLNLYVWLRSSASDAVSLTLDSVIFVTLAFAGAAPLLPLIIGQIVAKNIIGFIDNPWFVWYKAMLGGGKEGRETLDPAARSG